MDNYHDNDLDKIDLNDIPLKDDSGDLLDRNWLIEMLASYASRPCPKGSEAILVSGPWGSGKTSLKNLLAKRLRSTLPEAPILEINTWLCSSQEEISQHIIFEISRSLHQRRSYLGKEASRLWRKYLLESVVRTAALSGKGYYAFTAKLLETYWLCGRAPLDSRKNDLSSSLENLNYPCVVMLDDIDRLQKDELLNVLSLTKNLADLPNLKYVFFGDYVALKDIIETDHEPDRGDQPEEASHEGYLSKAFNNVISIPEITYKQRTELLGKMIWKALGSSNNINVKRWFKLVPVLLQKIKTIRDVKRLSLRLMQKSDWLTSDGRLSVDPIDLIALTAIEIFSEAAFRKIQENGDALTNWHAAMIDRSSTKINEEDSNLQKIVTDGSPVWVSSLFVQLFPNIAKHEGMEQIREEEARLGLRLCHRDNFDRYFNTVIKGDFVLPEEIDRVLAVVLEGKKSLQEALKGTDGRVELKDVLIRMEMLRYEELTKELSLGKLIGLVGASTNPKESVEIGLYEPINAKGIALRISYNLFDRITNIRDGLEVIEETMKSGAGLWLTARLIKYLEKRFVVMDEDTNEKIADVKKNWCAMAKKAANSNELINDADLGFVMWSWHDFGGVDDAKEWATELISSSEGAIRFLLAMSTKRYSNTEPYFSLKIRKDDLAQFVNLDSLKKSIDSLDEEQKRQYELVLNPYQEAIDDDK